MTKEQSIVEYMGREVVKNNIQETLGKKSNQFIASVASLVNSNPSIAECEQKSILSSCLVAAALDLPINQNLGFAYIIAYKNRNKGVTEAQFQMGYKGFIQLAMRSGQFKTINVTEVKDGELKGNNRLTGEMDFTWIDEDRDSLKTVGYVAYMELINGFNKQLYMTVEELTKHAGRYSQSYKRNSANMNIWRDDFDVMARKTVVKMLLSKYAPMTIDMQRATLADQAVIEGDQYQYPDNAPVDPEAVAAEKEEARIIKHIENSKTIEELDLCREAVESLSTDNKAYELFLLKENDLKNEVDLDEVDKAISKKRINK